MFENAHKLGAERTRALVSKLPLAIEPFAQTIVFKDHIGKLAWRYEDPLPSLGSTL